MSKRGSIYFFFILLLYTVVSQPRNLRFRSYSTVELSAKTVYSIVEDELGFLWLGTDNGLKRFDSYQFKDYTIGTELEQSSVYDLYKDHIGNLWIASDAGLYYFDRSTEVFTNIWEVLQINAVGTNAIQMDKDQIWVGTDQGLYEINLPDSTVQLYTTETEKGLSGNQIFDLLKGPNGRLWISTLSGGLSEFDSEKKTFRSFSYSSTDASSISSNSLRKLAWSQDNKLLVGTAEDGLNILDLDDIQFKTLVVDPSNSIQSSSAYAAIPYDDNRVWVGTWANGLNLVDLETGQVDKFTYDPSNKFSIPGNFIISTFRSHSGDIWFGTHEAGLFRLNPNEQQIVRFERFSNSNSLPTSTIRSILEDSEGFIWLGAGQGGLHRYDPDTDSFRSWIKQDGSRDAMARGTIWSMSESSDNRSIWFGTSRGVGKVDKLSGDLTFIEPDPSDPNSIAGNNVLKVLDDGKGYLWVGSWYGGLNRIEISSGNVEYWGHDEQDPSSLGSNNVNEIFIDSDDRVWIGTGESFSQFISTESGFINYPYSTLMIREGPEKSIWLCTNSGLMEFDPVDASFTPFGEENGLTTSSVSSILFDKKNRMWLSSDEGIDRYDYESGEVVHYGLAEGLAGLRSISRSAYIGNSGKIYFGGVDGVSVIDSEQEQVVDPPKIELTELLLSNQVEDVRSSEILSVNIESSDEIVLDYTNYIFAIEFAAIDFQSNKNLDYSYQLEGFDTDWIYTDALNRRAVYTNVPPGSYVFKVKANHPYLDWDSVVRSVPVTIVPPWWKTGLARISFVVLGISLVLVFIQVRLFAIRKQKKELEYQVQARTEEVVLQKEEIEKQATQLAELNGQKNKLIGIISHDLRNPLNTLKGITHILDPEILSKEDLQSFKTNLEERIEGVSASMLDLLNWAQTQMQGETTNPEEVNLYDLGNELFRLYLETAEEKSVVIENEFGHEDWAIADRNQLLIILRNLLGNALKFTSAGGTIRMSSRAESKENIILEVSDNGVGMDDDTLDRIFDVSESITTKGTDGETGVGLGLQLVKEYVEKNKGEISVHSAHGEGTTFTISLPRSLKQQEFRI